MDIDNTSDDFLDCLSREKKIDKRLINIGGFANLIRIVKNDILSSLLRLEINSLREFFI